MSDDLLPGVGLLVLGAVGIALGVIAGIALAMLIFGRTNYVEVVRDERGRIVQIVEMSDIQPILGMGIFNVSEPVERPFREITTP